MQNRFILVGDKLYRSFSVLVLIGFIYVGYNNVSNEVDQNERFTKAHEFLEKTNLRVEQSSNLTKTENRELLSLESAIRWQGGGIDKSKSENLENLTDEQLNKLVVKKLEQQEQPDVKPKFNPTWYLIDNQCFDFNGNALNVSRDKCYFIKDFHPGKTGHVLLFSFGYLLAAFLGLYFFRRWVMWVFRKVE